MKASPPKTKIATADADELARDPAMMRLQPKRARWWIAYGLIPSLALLLFLITPPLFEHAWLKITSLSVNNQIPVPGGGWKNVPTNYGRAFWEKGLPILALGASLLWGVAVAIQFLMVRQFLYRPMKSRISDIHFRSDMRLTPLPSELFLLALIRPHIKPLLISCLFLPAMGCLHLWSLNYFMGVPISWFDYARLLSLHCLVATLSIWEENTEDFKPFGLFFTLISRFRTIGAAGLYTLIILGFIPLHEFAKKHGDTHSMLLVYAAASISAFIMVLDAKRNWRMLCRYFEELE